MQDLRQLIYRPQSAGFGWRRILEISVHQLLQEVRRESHDLSKRVQPRGFVVLRVAVCGTAVALCCLAESSSSVALRPGARGRLGQMSFRQKCGCTTSDLALEKVDLRSQPVTLSAH